MLNFDVLCFAVYINLMKIRIYDCSLYVPTQSCSFDLIDVCETEFRLPGFRIS